MIHWIACSGRSAGRSRGLDHGSMSGLVWILALAVAVQLAAGTLAMMRLRSAGHRLGWFLLAAALLIMTGRRAVSLWSQLLHPDPSALAWGQEIVGLAISLLMLAAVLALGPWFQQAQRDATDAMRFATASSPPPGKESP